MFSIVLLAGLFAFSTASPRIIGGKDVEISSVPYQVSLRLNGDHICGAVLISSKHAITTATCLIVGGEYTIRAGSSKLSSGGVVAKVSKTIINQYFTPDSYDNDVGVIVLENDLQLSSDIQPAKLPAASTEIPNGKLATIAGWGSLKETSTDFSENLQAAQVPVLSKILCRGYYQEKYTNNMFCTGQSIGGIGPCFGDHGAGIIVDGEVIGLASWNENGCGRPNIPDVNTFIPKYRDFIDSATGL